jgi:hypothetical protein
VPQHRVSRQSSPVCSPLYVLQHDEGKEVECCAISYNGRLLATGGRDGVVCVSEFPSMPKQQYFADQDVSCVRAKPIALSIALRLPLAPFCLGGSCC